MTYSTPRTIFTAEIVGPFASFPNRAECATDAEYARQARLAEGRFVTGSRAGRWSPAALARLAARAGVVLLKAEAVSCDGSGKGRHTTRAIAL